MRATSATVTLQGAGQRGAVGGMSSCGVLMAELEKLMMERSRGYCVEMENLGAEGSLRDLVSDWARLGVGRSSINSLGKHDRYVTHGGSRGRTAMHACTRHALQHSMRASTAVSGYNSLHCRKIDKVD